MTWSPAQIGIAGFEPESTCKRDLRQVEWAAHQRMADLCFPEIGHSFAAVCLVLENRGRTLIEGPNDLAAPNCETVHHASRQALETACLPCLVSGRQIKGWLAIDVIEVGADDHGLF